MLDNYNANTYQNLSNADYRIWMSLDSNNPFPYDWKIAEIINFNWRIEEQERLKIESYLAIKYGITLWNWNIDYISSDWNIIWNKSNAWVYKNNIFWIARDDSSWLSQIKSKSTNSNAIITIEAIWEWTNLNPNFNDISDLESLIIAKNKLINN